MFRKPQLLRPVLDVRPTRWRYSAGLLVAAVAAGLAAGEPQDPSQRPPIVEVRQGGYVEKVDPSVDYKQRLPRIAPRSPDESLQAFHIVPGLHVELAAAEPLVADPVDLAFDENGRLFVAEMIPYAQGGSSQPGSPDGRVSVLEDFDGDGRFDRSTVLVDKLVWPTGIACFDGGVFVAAAPDLLYCKDTDGDGRADLREVVLTGFDLSNPNALPNSLRWGLDNRLHGMTSTAGGLLRAVRWDRAAADREASPVQARGRDFSIEPRTGQLRLESGGGQFGLALDEWGRKFESSNSNPCDQVMYDDRYVARNPCLVAPAARINVWRSGSPVFRTSPLEPWRIVRTEMRVGGVFSGPVEGGGTAAGYFTAACGLTIYQGDAWPAEYRGQGFVCEGAGNLVARMRFESDGVGFSAHRIDQGRDWLTSDEVWFKPIQFAHGPDGNLYLADMYREIFEHPDAVPPSVKKHLDLTTGKDRGRIYRIAAAGPEAAPSNNAPTRPVPRPKELGRLPTEDLVQLLAHPNGWHRSTAARLLYERQDPRAADPLRELAAQSPSALARMHALYALDGMNRLTHEIVLARLTDEHPRVREHAVRLSERLVAESPAVREKLCSLTEDPDLGVRYQLAFTLGEIAGHQATAALASIARRDAADPWVPLAVLSSSAGRAGELFGLLAQDTTWRRTAAGTDQLARLAEQAGLEARRDQVAEVLRLLEGLSEQPADAGLTRAVVQQLTAGLKRSHSDLLARLGDSGGSRAGRVLSEMIAEARSVATDDAQPPERRAEAVRALALSPDAAAVDVLTRLLDSRQPPQVQTAALESLQRVNDPRVAPAIVDAWTGLSPQVRRKGPRCSSGGPSGWPCCSAPWKQGPWSGPSSIPLGSKCCSLIRTQPSARGRAACSPATGPAAGTRSCSRTGICSNCRQTPPVASRSSRSNVPSVIAWRVSGTTWDCPCSRSATAAAKRFCSACSTPTAR